MDDNLQTVCYLCRDTMPTIQQPLRLLELCYRKSGPLLYDTCCNIERTHGDYDQQVCMLAISIVQRYLLDLLVSMLDGVGERAVQRHLWLNSLQDCRILYALIIHKSTESLSVLTVHSDSDVFSDFICSNLVQLKNLIHLNLSGIECSNRVLETIGNTCNKLKSLILNMSDKYRNHLVSNPGFACLANLENLRVLKDNSEKRFKNINKVVILQLLRALKNLEEIDHCLIGEVIDDYTRLKDFSGLSNGRPRVDAHVEVQPLALTCVKIDMYFIKPTSPTRASKFIVTSERPNPNIILSLDQTCPNLNHLELLSFDRCSDSIRNKFIDNLTNSSIILSTLALDGFSVNERFEQLLKTKGTHLKAFMFSPLQVSHSDLQFITQWCPNIPNLKFTKSSLADVYDDEYGCSKRIFSITGGI